MGATCKTSFVAFSQKGQVRRLKMPLTRQSRRSQQSEPQGSNKEKESTESPAKATKDHHKEEDEKEEDHDVYENEGRMYILDGVRYDTYEAMVRAKRQRNQQYMQGLGLESSKPKKKSRTTTKRKKPPPADPALSRKSSRLAGGTTDLVALDMHAKYGEKDFTTISLSSGKKRNINDGNANNDDDDDDDVRRYYKGRLNDGSTMTLEEAMNFNETKVNQWNPAMNDETGIIQAVTNLQQELCQSNMTASSAYQSPTSVMDPSNDTTTLLQQKIGKLSIDDEEYNSKVTPDRIYSMTTHPSTSKLIVCAGDKLGHIGLWDVNASMAARATTNSDETQQQNNHHHLVRPHSRVICCLEWLSPTCLVSASYDSTIRSYNLETGTFTQIFGTYADTETDTFYAEGLGYGLDQGYRYWVQYVTLDGRYKAGNNSANNTTDNPCMFLSTSIGTAMHVDLRSPHQERITFHEHLSEAKINTLSLHPNGYSLASGGRDGMVRLWDIRMFGDSRHRGDKRYGSGKKKEPQPLGTYPLGYSVNSSFFSPSGRTLLSTTIASLDLMDNTHLGNNTTSSSKKTKAKNDKPGWNKIPRNNYTGRWLTTLMAKWHDTEDIFVVGSMTKPRQIELFNREGKSLRKLEGDGLSSVMSRCAFHPSTQEITVVGGNSSGRVVVVR